MRKYRRYIMRLDDASEYMDVEKWNRMEKLLDKYRIQPIVGVIPDNQDPDMVEVYPKDITFWNKVNCWKEKGWTIAMHGYAHVFETKDGGINPVNKRSEFAGLSAEAQEQKIRDGLNILKKHMITPDIFFAPAHTFDLMTLKALERTSEIRVINDTIANNIYFYKGFYFIPQQSGHCRDLPFKVVTFCYHPNIMGEDDFKKLEEFLEKNSNNFQGYRKEILINRKRNLYDFILEKIYFLKK